jgi:5-methylcytosine-specific restriction endonuclease McrA
METDPSQDIKHLVLDPPSRQNEPKQNEPKEKQKKRIAESTEWASISQHLDVESQKRLLRDISDPTKEKTEAADSLIRMMKTKISGYKSQDNAKNVYDETRFIGLEEVVEALLSSDLKCFYCKRDVQLMYEYVREPRQWTLDRMNNQQGHNRGNVEIACLECNLRRKTMYHERYVYTKQAVIRKIYKYGWMVY